MSITPTKPPAVALVNETQLLKKARVGAKMVLFITRSPPMCDWHEGAVKS